jgi:hypothetical protein
VQASASARRSEKNRKRTRPEVNGQVKSATPRSLRRADLARRQGCRSEESLGVLLSPRKRPPVGSSTTPPAIADSLFDAVELWHLPRSNSVREIRDGAGRCFPLNSPARDRAPAQAVCAMPMSARAASAPTAFVARSLDEHPADPVSPSVDGLCSLSLSPYLRSTSAGWAMIPASWAPLCSRRLLATYHYARAAWC